MGNGTNPYLCLNQGVGGREPHVLTTPRAWAFPGKGFVQLAVFFLSFPHVPSPSYPAPRSLHQSCCRQCWKRTAFERKKKKKALRVLLGTSLRGLMSISVTAWVGDSVAVGQGQSRSLSEVESSFSRWESWGEQTLGAGRGTRVGPHQIQHSQVRGLLRPFPRGVLCQRLACLCGDKTGGLG